ncbi:MAG: hypothetical protein V2A63_04690 [Patescibacteria group bacterium]
MKTIHSSKNALIVAFALIVATSLAGCNQAQPASNTATTKNVSAGVDTDHDGLPDNAEKILGTNPFSSDTDGDGTYDKADQRPNIFDGTIAPSVGAEGFVIKNILVENNVDPVTGKSASDHLEIFVQNTGTKPISDFTAFVTFTDLATNETQSYRIPLPDFVLGAGETKSIHIDHSGAAGHFADNPNGMYYMSLNEMNVEVLLNAPGFAGQTQSVKKDKGGAELVD